MRNFIGALICGHLIGFVIGEALFPTTEDLAGTPAAINQTISDTARAHNIEPALALAVAEVESSMKPWKVRQEPKHHSVSVGLFQMFLRTAQDLGFKGNVDQLKDPTVNTQLGVTYLAKCSKRFHNVRGIACCHNAGLYTRASVCKNDDWVVHYENKVEKAYRKYSRVL